MKLASTLVAVLLLLTGCSIPSLPARSVHSTPANVPATPHATIPAVATIAVPDLTGMPANEARDALRGVGLEVEWDADDQTVLMPSNWTVTSQAPAAGSRAEKGTAVTLTVEKPKPTTAPVEATSAGLTGTYAQAACDQAGRSQFPYGFDGHWVLGKLADEIREDRWFFKLEATVKNQYNAKRDVEVECTVGGTNAAPVVESFYAY